MIRRFADPEALAVAAADEVVRIARGTASGARAHIALSGGSTPRRMFELLAARGRDALPWDRVDLWWVDERTVPPDHPDCNYGMAKRALIDPLALDRARVHRMRGEDEPEAAARDYEQQLVAAVGDPPAFALVLLGLGPDGHTASLFPGSPALGEDRHSVVANRVDSPLTHGPTMRVTLTAPAINAARAVRFVVAGADKADALHAVLEGERNPLRCPAQLIRPASGDLVWLVDDAAASKLRGAS